MNPLRSFPDYEQFIYTLPQQYPSVRRSTLTVIRRGASVARLTGELELVNGYRIVVREVLSFAGRAPVIADYGYEIWHGGEKVCWYDSQPHPNDPALAATNPHHKHVAPDIKHNRIPASELSFSEPNLPFLIRSVEQLLAS